MTVTEWTAELDMKCAGVVDAFEGLYTHMDALDEIPGISDDELEEITAVAVVKMNRMQRNADAFAYDDTELLEDGVEPLKEDIQ